MLERIQSYYLTYKQTFYSIYFNAVKKDLRAEVQGRG